MAFYMLSAYRDQLTNPRISQAEHTSLEAYTCKDVGQ